MGATHSALYYHVIFGTKTRAALIGSEWEDRLFSYLGGIVRKLGGKLLVAGGAGDHVHLLLSLKPVHSIADLLRDLKRDSSKWVHEQMTLRDFGWQDGYGIFTVSVSALPSVTEYIQNQREHHEATSFREEYVKFLERHGVEFDERFI
jgi:REP element-mobilizing transposase RayT